MSNAKPIIVTTLDVYVLFAMVTKKYNAKRCSSNLESYKRNADVSLIGVGLDL